MEIVVRTGEGEHDITEGVQCLYDLVIQSMDWGSGFLTADDVLPVVKLAALCGFGEVDEAERYLRAIAAGASPDADWRKPHSYAWKRVDPERAALITAMTLPELIAFSEAAIAEQLAEASD